MTFRRSRRRGFSRARGKPRGPKPFWAHAVFNDSALDIVATNSITEMVMLDESDWADPDLQTSRQFGLVERIVLTGGIAWVPQTTTPAANTFGLATALYVLDVDDVAIEDLWSSSSAASILRHADRVLFTKYDHRSVLETNSFTMTGGSPNHVEVDIDLKVKVKVDLDTLICFGIQFGESSTDTTMLAATFSGLARVLVRKLT